MVVSMKDFNTSSDKIAKIIKVIDEISFQTNVLALNAAMEAARAGKADRGSRWSRTKYETWRAARKGPKIQKRSSRPAPSESPHGSLYR